MGQKVGKAKFDERAKPFANRESHTEGEGLLCVIDCMRGRAFATTSSNAIFLLHVPNIFQLISNEYGVPIPK